MLTNSKPFNQLKFSCTSVPSDVRLDISNKIKAMGGIYCNNLMSDVSVLVVGDINTDKYKFSIQKRYDILFIDADTIFELHKKWVSGENILAQVNNHYSISELRFIPTMAPLKNVRICLSRISSHNRKDIINLINSNGGICTDSLATNTNFLITEEKSGKRYEKALEWNIPILHTQWIIDCIKRGGVLDGQYYNIRIKDPEKIGKGACVVWKELETIVSKRRAESRKRPSSRMQNDGKLDSEQETANEEPEEGTDIDIKRTKKNVSSLKAWNSIINKNNHLNNPDIINEQKDDETNSNMEVIKVSNNNTNNNLDEDESNNTKENTSISENITALNDSIDQMKSSKKTFSFEGMFFFVEGFNQKERATLVKIIKSYNGEVTQSSADKVNYIIIKNDFFKNKETMKSLQSKYANTPIMTEWFIERCLYYNEIKEDIWGRPLIINKRLKSNLSIPKLKVSISGFAGTELLHLEKMIRGLHEYIVLSENLTKNTDLLIINIALVGLNRTNSKGLFNNTADYVQLLEDAECNKVSLHSIKKKLMFCQNNNIPIYSILFLFQVFFSDLSYLNLNELNLCVYYPKSQGSSNLLQEFASVINCSNQDETPAKGASLSASISDSKGYRPSKRQIKISGKAAESSLSYKESNGIIDTNLYENPLRSEKEENIGTQISYGEAQTDESLVFIRNPRTKN